ncbi:MAG TPA: CpsD/CapB family tyrosine-protein kinase [Lactovum miscens]|uniref:CpsD/CapB family tyrosine-protein kinase n=1 Tax=Lactovum miscens TaxID=190387 RepID=UPI002EDA3BEC
MAKKNKQIDTIRALITSVNPKSPISEQYRTIRTNIEFIMSDRNLKSIMITSPEAEVGKSTTVSNLAVTFAQQGKKVLLIDADLHKPSAYITFHVENRVGLANVLARQVDINSALQRTQINENLTILTSGPIPPNPSELLGSEAFRLLIENASSRFDVILIDAPPILAVTDSQILSRTTDGVILVARANQTKKEELVKAKKLLDQVQANVLGVVLHGVDPKGTAYYYYYGAG